MGIPNKINQEELLFLYNLGLNDYDIANKLSVTHSAIWHQRKKLNLKPNTNRGAQRGQRNPVFSAIRNGKWRDPSKELNVRKLLSKIRFGPQNPYWKHGKSRPRIRNHLRLDGFSLEKCELCGSTKSIHVHHINGNIYDNSLSNLMIVCSKCHAKFHNWGQKPYARQKITCKNCGKTIERVRSAIEKIRNHFCSLKCWYEWRRKNRLRGYKWANLEANLRI